MQSQYKIPTYDKFRARARLMYVQDCSTVLYLVTRFFDLLIKKRINGTVSTSASQYSSGGLQGSLATPVILQLDSQVIE